MSSVAWGVTGGLIAYKGTMGLIGVSQYFAEKEAGCEEGSCWAIAFKIAKWAFLGLAGFVGLIGSTVVSLSAAFLVTGISGGTIGPLAIIAGIIAGAVVAALSVKKVWDQGSEHRNTIIIPAPIVKKAPEKAPEKVSDKTPAKT
jgi:hypothetical protein